MSGWASLTGADADVERLLGRLDGDSGRASPSAALDRSPSSSGPSAVSFWEAAEVAQSLAGAFDVDSTQKRVLLGIRNWPPAWTTTVSFPISTSTVPSMTRKAYSKMDVCQ